MVVGIFGVGGDQALVDIAADLVAAELEAFLRIQADDVVDLMGHDEHVFRRIGKGGREHFGINQGGGGSAEQGAAGKHRIGPLLDKRGT